MPNNEMLLSFTMHLLGAMALYGYLRILSSYITDFVFPKESHWFFSAIFFLNIFVPDRIMTTQFIWLINFLIINIGTIQDALLRQYLQVRFTTQPS